MFIAADESLIFVKICSYEITRECQQSPKTKSSPDSDDITEGWNTVHNIVTLIYYILTTGILYVFSASPSQSLTENN